MENMYENKTGFPKEEIKDLERARSNLSPDSWQVTCLL